MADTRVNASNASSVAVVVLTWNQRALTLDCLQSLSQMDYPNYRVIVVDNGSQDGTAEAVLNGYGDVTVLENGVNLGFAEGNNVGVRYALADGAEYVMLLNNDTLVQRQMLTRLIPVAKGDPRIGIVGPLVLYQEPQDIVWSAGNRIDWTSGALHRLYAEARDSGLEAPYQVDYVTGCALCIKRDVVEQVGLIDPRYFIYYEETDWCLRARAKDYKAVIVPQSRIWHRVSAAMKQDSPATTYYMTRNVFLFLASHLTGRAKAVALTSVFVREIRTLIAHSTRQRNRHLRAHRDARLLALRDVILGRWGKMGPDVAAVCYPDPK